MTTDKGKQDLRYDAACKQVLSERGILAYILKECVAEYADLDYQQIEQCKGRSDARWRNRRAE